MILSKFTKDSFAHLTIQIPIEMALRPIWKGSWVSGNALELTNQFISFQLTKQWILFIRTTHIDGTVKQIARICYNRNKTNLARDFFCHFRPFFFSLLAENDRGEISHKISMMLSPIKNVHNVKLRSYVCQSIYSLIALINECLHSIQCK